jgi:hypothetical protein
MIGQYILDTLFVISTITKSLVKQHHAGLFTTVGPIVIHYIIFITIIKGERHTKLSLSLNTVGLLISNEQMYPK